MDTKFFRLPTTPNLYPSQSPVTMDIPVMGETQQFPAPDSRFPGWAAPMSDARLVTDYRPHCLTNVPAGKQFPTKQWMQRSGSELIEYNRKVYSERMGANLPFDDSVVPPPVEIMSCKKGGCGRTATGAAGGIGIERQETVPELFGTFTYLGSGACAGAPKVALTTRQEGGRNTVRGVF